MTKLKIAFDWDDTAETSVVQDVIRECIAADHDVQIVTTRWDEEHLGNYEWYKFLAESERFKIHKPIYDFCKEVNIPYHFTNMQYKKDFLIENNFDVLVDDNYEEGMLLQDTNIKFIWEPNLQTLKKELLYDK